METINDGSLDQSQNKNFNHAKQRLEDEIRHLNTLRIAAVNPTFILLYEAWRKDIKSQVERIRKLRFETAEFERITKYEDSEKGVNND